MPVKKIPKISDLVKDPEPVKEHADSSSAEKTVELSALEDTTTVQGTETQLKQIQQESAAPAENISEPQSDNQENLSSVDTENVETSALSDAQSVDVLLTEKTENVAETTVEELSVDEKFKASWGTMFELLFREIATIYYPLKGMVPEIKHNVIHVKVKNESMKENFESRTRLALEYLRNNYDSRIDGIKVEVDAQTETVNKVIYDTQDKMNDLKRENPDLPEFLKILNLSAKDM